MQNARLYREIAVVFLECAKNATTASDRDASLAGAVYYHALAHVAEDAERGQGDAAQPPAWTVARVSGAAAGGPVEPSSRLKNSAATAESEEAC